MLDVNIWHKLCQQIILKTIVAELIQTDYKAI